MELDIGTPLKNRRIITIDLTQDDRETEFQIKHSNTTISLSLKPTKSLSLKRKQPESAELEKLKSVVINISEEEPVAKKAKSEPPTVSQEIKAWYDKDKTFELSNLAKLRRAVGKLGLTGKNVDFVFDHRALDKEFLTLVEKSPQITRSMVTHSAQCCIDIAAGFYRECPKWASIDKKNEYLETLGFNVTIVELLIAAMDKDYVTKAFCSDLAQDLIAVCDRLVWMGTMGDITLNIVSKAIHDPHVLIISPTDEATPAWLDALDELRDVWNGKMVGTRERQKQRAQMLRDPDTLTSSF